MKRIIFIVFAIHIALSSCSSLLKKKETFEVGNREFVLNQKPFLIRAAEIHYPRIPKEYWEHRIEMCKSMGMNTICLYVFWNIHEQKMDSFDFEGQNDIKEFCELAQKHGMYIIVRPGPYVCAEWDMGGLPWWLLKKEDIQVRTKEDAFFIERMKIYFSKVAEELAPLTLNNGGNIIMVQVENEYPLYGNDKEYMTLVKDAIVDAGFNNVELFTCAWSHNYKPTMLEGVLPTINFGAGSNIDEQFKDISKDCPTIPLMCSEYWSGWFDHWGRPHATRSVEHMCGSMKDMLDRKISFSLYMAHGGTTFGQWGGANTPPYSTMATSYDYDAPISEAGWVTPKYTAVRELLGNYLNEGEEIPEKIPAQNPVITIPEFTLEEVAPLFSNLPEPKFSEEIKPMEMFDQGWGRILYRTKLPAGDDKRKLLIDEVHDWAVVYVDGEKIGKLDRRRGEKILDLPQTNKETRLDILVEATGRVNFGGGIIDRKGITKSVTVLDNKQKTELKGWEVYNFPVDHKFQASLDYKKSGKIDVPAWYRGTFNLEKVGDTFLNVETWGKGMVWVNGYNIGRYWRIGPQQALYMPGCWLKEGENEIIILDLDTPEACTVEGLDKPVLDDLRPDKTLFSRKEGETLDLSKEKAAMKDSFKSGNKWQKFNFKKTQKCRYFCLEALSSFRNDGMASMAEFYVLDKNGKDISRNDWSIAYADSEEVMQDNNDAAKIFDLQESTFWHTSWSKEKEFPHHVVIDLGKEYDVSGFRYLPRPQENGPAMIKDFRIFLKETPFKK